MRDFTNLGSLTSLSESNLSKAFLVKVVKMLSDNAPGTYIFLRLNLSSINGKVNTVLLPFLE